MKTLNALKFAIERDITLFAFGARPEHLNSFNLMLFIVGCSLAVIFIAG